MEVIQPIIVPIMCLVAGAVAFWMAYRVHTADKKLEQQTEARRGFHKSKYDFLANLQVGQSYPLNPDRHRSVYTSHVIPYVRAKHGVTLCY